MTPWELAKITEHSHQRAIFAWAAMAANNGFEWADEPLAYDHRTAQCLGRGQRRPVPSLAFLFAIHNQGHGDAVRGAMAKAEGVKAGVPDMMLPVARDGLCGLFIELKLPKDAKRKGGVSDAQTKWHQELNFQGYQAVVAYGWLDAVGAIKAYL